MVRLTAALIELRAIIGAGGPDDEAQAMRLSLRATSHIADKSLAAGLHEELCQALVELGFFAAMDLDLSDIRESVMRLVDRIDAASRPD